MEYFKLGLRNILRNGRRSAVTVLAISFGLASINLFSGYIHNVYAGLADQAIHGERLGHLTIMKKGAMQNGKLEPEKYLFSSEDLHRIQGLLAGNPDVALTTMKLSVSGLISNGKVSTIFIGEGMIPQDAIKLNGNFRKDRGGLLDPAKPEAGLVAADLARMLKLEPAQYATLLVSTLSGQTNAMDLEVLKTFNTGNAGTNDKFLLLPLAYVQQLLSTSGADRIVVMLHDGDRLDAARTSINAALVAAGFDVELYTWKDLSDFYNQVHRLFNMIFAFIFSIVLIVVLMSIINTTTMSVVERTREIGTLRALGMNRRQVSTLFTVEGLQLALLGGAIGLLLTLVAGAGVNLVGFSYVPPNSSDAVHLLIDFVPTVMGASFVLLAIVASIAAFIPARRVTTMKVVDALGHV
ncbi:putative ABC transporter, permease protein [Paraburkholderia ribeironis]|uniref:Putative ABC transporter, permease protein n=1 Tax=Paraburkholderia ribeironis TaxID=1247936 RepID=A0A1N7S7A6_9BURK|nr:FtsX-like permease family protein [Paraburkholderia ribeironis]SIT43212.1 putative ABC transporter, permease protein [Paraburkholderia ribeironis]